ncbi:hypothetical protein ACTI_25660 [Actinoplanes sp. OR16]|nr:hypothetical protein ACTI_25660 [Actinoplanes sp. OR16]
MHGYQLMHAIAGRTGGRWQPSPGAIYPAISQLEDEGLVTVTASAGRKLVILTRQGRESAGEAQPLIFEKDDAIDLRPLLMQVHDAARQVARTGTEAQVEQAAQILADTRRAIYLLLAEG